MESKENLYLTSFIALSGFFCLSVVGAFSKLISNHISIFTILFFQTGICLLCTLPLLVKRGLSSIKTTKFSLHLARDLAGILSFFCLFYSFKNIPLVNGSLLQNTAPLWLPFIAFIWLRTRMRGDLWWGILIGFIGVILILKPGGASFSIGSFSALASGILLGFTLLAVQRLAATEPTNRILFYYFLVGVIVTGPLAYFEYVHPSTRDLLLLIGIGVFTYLAQMLVTYSFKHGKATVLAPLNYTVVIFSGLFDWLIWNNTPDFITCVGAILVAGGGILSIHFEKKYQKKLSSPIK